MDFADFWLFPVSVERVVARGVGVLSPSVGYLLTEAVLSAWGSALEDFATLPLLLMTSERAFVGFGILAPSVGYSTGML